MFVPACNPPPFLFFLLLSAPPLLFALSCVCLCPCRPQRCAAPASFFEFFFKRAAPQDDALQLEHIVGNTILHAAATSSNSAAQLVAYAAGCVVVVQNPASRATFFLRAPEAKPLACVAISPDGSLLAVGEKVRWRQGGGGCIFS